MVVWKLHTLRVLCIAFSGLYTLASSHLIENVPQVAATGLSVICAIDFINKGSLDRFQVAQLLYNCFDRTLTALT